MSYQQFVKSHMAMEHIKQLPQKERMAKIGAMWRAQKGDTATTAKPNKTVKTVKAKKTNKGAGFFDDLLQMNPIYDLVGGKLAKAKAKKSVKGAGFFDDLLKMNPIYDLVGGKLAKAKKPVKGGAISGGAISGGNIDANIGADSDIELEPEMVGGGFLDDLSSMNTFLKLASGGALVKSDKASPSKQLNALLSGNATHSGGYQQFNLPALKPITVSIKQQLINKR